MKKIFAVIALLLCLFLLAACEAQDLLGQFTDKVTEAAENAAEMVDEAKTELQQISTADTATAVPAETPQTQATPAAPAVTIPAAEQVQTQVQAASPANVYEGEIIDETEILPEPGTTAAPTGSTAAPVGTETSASDMTSLSADQCVEDRDGLPHIVLDCDGARSINEDVEEMFRYLVGSDSCTIYYEYYKNAGRILSVMVAQTYTAGNDAYFTPFNLDLATGRRLSGSELLSLLGAGATALADAELQLMGQEFEYEYGMYKEGETAGLYDEQYQRTISTDNADTERIWLGSDGRLNFVAKIFALEGTEYHEYPMDSGLRY